MRFRLELQAQQGKWLIFSTPRTAIAYVPLLWLAFRFQGRRPGCARVMAKAHSLMDILYMLASL